jgi:hypothetical protein
MEKNNQSDLGVMNKLALVAEGIQNTIVKGKSTVIFELNEKDYKETINQLDYLDKNLDKFKIDISGIDFIFLKIGENT